MLLPAFYGMRIAGFINDIFLGTLIILVIALESDGKGKA